MWRLIKSECYKLIKSDYYRRFIVIYLFVAIAALSQDRETKMGFLLTGYEWFCVRQMMIGWAGIPLPFFVAEYMAAEFTNHGFESALMCGFTRKELFRAKIMVCLMGGVSTDIDQYHRRNDNHNSAEWIWCNAEWNDNRFYGEKVYLLYFGIYHYKWRYVFHICSYDQK